MLKDFLTGNCNHIECVDYMNELTPVERVGELMFKREDVGFAPLGIGSINGSKARQCMWLIRRLYEKGYGGIATGASVLSPQHCIVAAMAAHFGMSSLHVVGATNPESSSKHPSVAIAKLLGAKFDYIGSAYNSSLQPRVAHWVNTGKTLNDRSFMKIEYGITVDHRDPKNTPGLVTAFHLVGARQTTNLPEEMETLIIPAGSCNTFVSIMYGLAASNLLPNRKMHPNLRKIIAVGIGPSRLNWAKERLEIISHVANYDASEYLYNDRVEFEYIDTHRMGVYKYSDKVNINYEGLELHYTYESKCFQFLSKHRPHELFNEKTVFWIVGGPLSLEATKRAISAAD